MQLFFISTDEDSNEEDEDKEIYDEAMTKGYIESALALLILMGVTGSGKSLFQRLVLGLPVPDDSASTSLAESAVRSMSVCQVAVDSVKWVIVGPQDMMDMVAKTIKERKWMQRDSSQSVPVESTPKENTTPGSLQQPPEPEHDPASEVQSQHQETVPQEATLESFSPDFIKVLKEMNLDSVLIQKMNESCATTVQKLMDVDFIYLLDSGGQPPFREMLPHFVQQASAVVLFQKLNERLDFKPTIRYREEGRKVDEGYESQLTNEQILHQYVQGVQSHNSKLFVVGTHKDKEDDCKEETRQMKNEKLLNAFRPILGSNNIVPYDMGDSDQLIFPVNSTSRKEDDETATVAQSFRRKVMDNCIGDKEKIPLPWFLLEQLLRLLAQKMEVKVLSIEECYEAARNILLMPQNVCETAIKYLGKLNIMFYRPTILPGLVFSNAQVILDKITELVRCSHALRTKGNTTKVPACMVNFEFRDLGLVNAEILGKAFPAHYRDGLFTPSDLLSLLEDLLIAGKLENGKYFIPSLLPDLQTEKIPQYRVTSPEEPAPLVIYYPKSWVPVGVMPSLVACLRNTRKWTPTDTYGKPTCMYHNCIEFELPTGEPGSVFLIDSTKFLEIHAKPTLQFDQNLCSDIKKDILTGLKEVHNSLHYDQPKAEIGFLCSCECSREELHYAKVVKGKSCWVCSNNKRKGGKLNTMQEVWLTEGQ